jgi:repressor LexA
MSIDANIKRLREASKMSQEELGRRIGVKRAAIQKYEKGTVENIPIKSIEKIASVFDVSPTYLIGWTANTQVEELYSRLNDAGRTRAFGHMALLVQIYSKDV